MTTLESARAEVARLEHEQTQKQASYDHVWIINHTVKVTPGYYVEDYFGRLIEGQSPPRRWVKEVAVDNWQRTCGKCGKSEHTGRYTTETIVVKKPDFRP
jgi:hypothetical protein